MRLPVCAEKTRPVHVPDFHAFRHVHVQAEVRCEHALESGKQYQVIVRPVPDPLKLVVVDIEMYPQVRYLSRPGIVEADEIIRYRIAWAHDRYVESSRPPNWRYSGRLYILSDRSL